MNDEPKPHVYLFGYSGRHVFDLARVTSTLDAVVVDIRLCPVSRQPEWGLGFLKHNLKDRYIRLGEWGNKNYSSNRYSNIDISNFEKGLEIFQSIKSKAVILMCACKSNEHCHRRLIGEKLIALGYEVSELNLNTTFRVDYA